MRWYFHCGPFHADLVIWDIEWAMDSVRTLFLASIAWRDSNYGVAVRWHYHIDGELHWALRCGRSYREFALRGPIRKVA